MVVKCLQNIKSSSCHCYIFTFRSPLTVYPELYCEIRRLKFLISHEQQLSITNGILYLAFVLMNKKEKCICQSRLNDPPWQQAAAAAAAVAAASPVLFPFSLSLRLSAVVMTAQPVQG